MNQTISHSQLRKLEECSRKYKYVYEDKLKDEVGVAAEYSTHMVHGPLEYLYLNGSRVEVPWRLFWDKFVAVVGLPGLGDARYSLETAKRIYEEMLSYHEEDDKRFTGFVAEEAGRSQFNITHEGVEYGFEYISKPDVIGVEIDADEEGEVVNLGSWVIDFKYSSSDHSKHSLDFNRQFLGQVWAHNAKGFICYAIGVGRTKVRPSVTVMRYESEPTPHIIEEFVSELKVRVKQRLISQIMDIWPKQEESCFNYGRPCSFLSICQAGAFTKEAIRRRKERDQ